MATASPATPQTPVPRRSRRRLLVVGVFVLLFAAAPVGYYFVNNWLHQRELDALYRELDAEDPNWRYADLGAAMPAPPPDEQNAALQILRVRDLLVKTPFKVPFKVLSPKAPRPKTKVPNLRNARMPEEWANEIRAALAKLDPTILDEARKLKDLPEGRFRFEAVENPFDETKRPDVDVPLLSSMDLLVQDAKLRTHNGDIEGAAESFLAALHAAHAIGDHPTLMAQLIRAAGQDQAVDAIERTLGQGVVSEKRLAALQHALERAGDHNALYPAMRGERAWCEQYYVLLEEGKISYPDLFGRKNPSLRERMYQMFPSLLLRGHADQLRLHSELVRASKLPEEAREEAFQAVAKKAFDNPDVFMQGPGFIVGQAAQFQHEQGRLRCAATALAAERYRLAHARWPDNAEELVKAGLLKEALKDPFDGQPLRWQQTPTGIVIYSIGSKIGAGANVRFELWRPEMRGMPAPR